VLTWWSAAFHVSATMELQAQKIDIEASHVIIRDLRADIDFLERDHAQQLTEVTEKCTQQSQFLQVQLDTVTDAMHHLREQSQAQQRTIQAQTSDLNQSAVMTSTLERQCMFSEERYQRKIENINNYLGTMFEDVIGYRRRVQGYEIQIMESEDCRQRVLLRLDAILDRQFQEAYNACIKAAAVNLRLPIDMTIFKYRVVWSAYDEESKTKHSAMADTATNMTDDVACTQPTETGRNGTDDHDLADNEDKDDAEGVGIVADANTVTTSTRPKRPLLPSSAAKMKCITELEYRSSWEKAPKRQKNSQLQITTSSRPSSVTGKPPLSQTLGQVQIETASTTAAVKRSTKVISSRQTKSGKALLSPTLVTESDAAELRSQQHLNVVMNSGKGPSTQSTKQRAKTSIDTTSNAALSPFTKLRLAGPSQQKDKSSTRSESAMEDAFADENSEALSDIHSDIDEPMSEIQRATNAPASNKQSRKSTKQLSAEVRSAGDSSNSPTQVQGLSGKVARPFSAINSRTGSRVASASSTRSQTQNGSCPQSEGGTEGDSDVVTYHYEDVEERQGEGDASQEGGQDQDGEDDDGIYEDTEEDEGHDEFEFVNGQEGDEEEVEGQDEEEDESEAEADVNERNADLDLTHTGPARQKLVATLPENGGPEVSGKSGTPSLSNSTKAELLLAPMMKFIGR
jgi:hypothetical protein